MNAWEKVMRPNSGFPLREGKLLKPSRLSSQRLKSLAIGKPGRCFAAVTAANGANGKSDVQGSERAGVAAKEAASECGQPPEFCTASAPACHSIDRQATRLPYNSLTDNSQALLVYACKK